MKSIATSLFGACIALACVTASAQDTMKKAEPMPGAGMMKKDMTLQECKDHAAMMKKEGMPKDGMKKDAATMKQETKCADMIAKDPVAPEPKKQ